ncbi:MAG: LPXTG cell wall anchor domain-containing protein [Acutalibacteraceae bacterium]
MKKRTVFSVLCISLIAVFLFSGGLTLASFKTRSSTVNNITLASVKGSIIEEYEQGQTVYPADVVNKKVQVKNTGTADAIVRVKIEKAWGDYRESDGTLAVNPSLSTDNILIEYNTDNWLYKSDGYFYYKGVLTPGEITPSLFDSFEIDGKNTGGEYKNKNADIIVTTELVQAACDGISFWGTTFEDLGIKYTESQQVPIVTTVEFKNADVGFVFELNDGDLFANFKDLMPGETRSQEITVTNSWNKETEIFLNAEYIRQQAEDDETYALIEKLLREKATISITDGKGNIIYSGAVYGNYDVNSNGNNSMKNPISLGSFKPNETKSLYVNLSVDKNTDNNYKALLGSVKWVFSAEGTSSDIDIPKTGNDLNTVIYAFVTLISAVVLIFLVYFSRKKRSI